MKTNTALRVVENNAHASKDFTIQASGKMFHMVISGLYSNKAQSITRELWSNAFDAHSMVGKEDVPFEVTFPTAMTPVFSVRDFGPGIAHDDMEGFYTVLGHSTKENTNKAVGKWGVGRMSPMSYTDTFSVVSRHKGMVAYYSVQLGPDGAPQLHVLAPPSPTTEADGLEVSFPVKRGDIGLFQNAAEVVSYGFKVSPAVTNSKEKSFKPIKKSYEGDGFYVYEDPRMSGPHAQMGCVLYPIPRQYVDRWRNIVYQFDIGDLEVTASREALSFGPNDPTEKNIRAKYKAVEVSILAKAQSEVDAQTTEFRALRMATKLNSIFGTNCTYKGAKALRYMDIRRFGLDLHCGHMSRSGKQAGFGNYQSFDVLENSTIFVEDTSNKKGCVRASLRIGHALKPSQHFIWIRADLSNPVDKAGVDALIAELDFPVQYVKDLYDMGAKPRGTRAKITASVINTSNGRLEKIDLDDAAFTKGGHYVPMSNNNISTHKMNNLCKLWANVHKANVIFVPKTLWKKFESGSQWKLFAPAIEELINKLEPEVRKTFSKDYSDWKFSHLQKFEHVGGRLGAFATEMKQYLANPNTTLYGLSKGDWSYVLREANKSMILNTVGSEYSYIMSTYPLLRSYDSTHHQDYVNYIKLIDKR